MLFADFDDSYFGKYKMIDANYTFKIRYLQLDYNWTDSRSIGVPPFP